MITATNKPREYSFETLMLFDSDSSKNNKKREGIPPCLSQDLNPVNNKARFPGP